MQHPQAEVNPRYDTLVAQDDVDAATNRAARAERTAIEIRQSNRELLERVRMLERHIVATRDLDSSLARCRISDGLAGMNDLRATDSAC